MTTYTISFFHATGLQMFQQMSYFDSSVVVSQKGSSIKVNTATMAGKRMLAGARSWTDVEGSAANIFAIYRA